MASFDLMNMIVEVCISANVEEIILKVPKYLLRCSFPDYINKLRTDCVVYILCVYERSTVKTHFVSFTCVKLKFLIEEKNYKQNICNLSIGLLSV